MILLVVRLALRQLPSSQACPLSFQQQIAAIFPCESSYSRVILLSGHLTSYGMEVASLASPNHTVTLQELEPSALQLRGHVTLTHQDIGGPGHFKPGTTTCLATCYVRFKVK